MAKHEFGMMERAPLPGEQYDDYEPEKYCCISVHDDYIEPILLRLNSIDFFWHSLDMPGKGINYTGITLIPPSSMEAMRQVLTQAGAPELLPLYRLLAEARAKNKYVIHFGI